MRFELSPCQQWDGFQDRVRAMQPIFHYSLFMTIEKHTTLLPLSYLPAHTLWSLGSIRTIILMCLSIVTICKHTNADSYGDLSDIAGKSMCLHMVGAQGFEPYCPNNFLTRLKFPPLSANPKLLKAADGVSCECNASKKRSSLTFSFLLFRPRHVEV